MADDDARYVPSAVELGAADDFLDSAGGDYHEAVKRSKEALGRAAVRRLASSGRPSTKARDVVGVSRGFLNKRKESKEARIAAVERLIMQAIDRHPMTVSVLRAQLDRSPEFQHYASRAKFDFIEVVMGLTRKGRARFVANAKDSTKSDLVACQGGEAHRLTDPEDQALALRDQAARMNRALRRRGAEIDARVPDERRSVVLDSITASYPATMSILEACSLYNEKGHEAWAQMESAWERAGIALTKMKIDITYVIEPPATTERQV